MDLLVEFFRHNTASNNAVLEACRALDEGQLGFAAKGTYGSIGATLVHVANGQRGYAARLLGRERPERLEEDPFPGFDRLAEIFELGNSELEEAAARDASRDDPVHLPGEDPSETWTMPVGLFLLQAVNHGTDHRSQIATALTELGIEPPPMDGWTYFFESGLLVSDKPGES